MNALTITPRELDGLCRRRPVELIDVRTPAEFRECHVDFARLVPLDTLDPRAVMAGSGAAARDPVYLICRSGARAKRACTMFSECGYDNVVTVEGGTMGWEQAGFPVVHGKMAISLERQVRIAAGTLVLLGSSLGPFLHPAFIGLTAFVGAGLVFAGITDTCGMAMVLAKMPWNRVGPESRTCEPVGPSRPDGNLPGGTHS